MTPILLFDVNETLLDLSALDARFEEVFGDSSVRGEWFSALLGAALVTTVLGTYHDFGRIGAAALETVAGARDVRLSEEDRGKIIGGMRSLPPHPEVPEALARLQRAGFRLAALTNSPPDTARQQLENAELSGCFEAILSADAAKALKPAAAAYQTALHTLQSAPEEAWMIAAHDWDIAGAMHAGCRGAFIARGKTFNALYPPPDMVAGDLGALADKLLQAA